MIDLHPQLDSLSDALAALARVTRERDLARDGLYDTHKFNEELSARVTVLEDESTKLRDLLGAANAGIASLIENVRQLVAENAALVTALQELVDAQDATVEQFTEAEIDRLEKAMRAARVALPGGAR